MLQTTEEVLASEDILDLPDIHLGQRITQEETLEETTQCETLDLPFLAVLQNQTSDLNIPQEEVDRTMKIQDNQSEEVDQTLSLRAEFSGNRISESFLVAENDDTKIDQSNSHEFLENTNMQDFQKEIKV